MGGGVGRRTSGEGRVLVHGEVPLTDPLAFAGGSVATLLRFIALAAIVVAAGAVAFRWLVAPRAGFHRALDGPLGTLAVVASALMLLVAWPRLWMQAAALAMDPGDTWQMVPRVLGTTWGTGAWLQVVSAATMIVAVRLAKGARADTAWAVGAAAAFALCASPGLMGHANAVESARLPSLAMDFVHVAAVGAWVGGLVPLALLARGADGDTTAAMIGAFHRLAAACVVVTIGTGIAAVFVRFGGIGPLLGTRYGAVLAAKLAAVLVVLLYGLAHLRSGEARAREGKVAPTLAREAMFALLVLAATSVLIATEPA